MAAGLILARRQIRLAAVEALKAARLGIEIQSPGNWSTPEDDLPMIMLRTPGDRKQAIAKQQPNFDTTVTLELEAKVKGSSADDAQDAIDELGAQIEQALFTDYTLNRLISLWASVETRTGVSSEGRDHIGALKILANVELFEEFYAEAESPLEGVDIHVDTGSPFDPTGTYAGPPFPASVNPAPRTSGPDGRDEGGLSIDLPQ
jgi:hypothetical protein